MKEQTKKKDFVPRTHPTKKIISGQRYDDGTQPTRIEEIK